MKRAGLIFAALVVFAAAARADEFHLKDGSTVVGVIVGYEGNSFRVKTSYGFALVDRDAIASITVSKATASEETRAKPPARENPKPASSSSSANVSATKADVASKGEASVKPAHDAKSEEARKSSHERITEAAAKKTEASNPNASSPSKPIAPASASASPASPETEPAPIPVREEVQGNLYINETYGFRIYKPPDWDVIEGARAALPGAVVAMGTLDQTTYLIIGLEPSSGTPQTHIASTNERLSNMFEGFRPSPAKQTVVAGLRADVYQFQGMANDQQWSGTVVLLSRGDNFFTIFGVTSANTDLVQIQQNVISRTIASLQFTKP